MLIFGIAGGCRCDELWKMTIDDVEDLDSLILVKIRTSKNHKSSDRRLFIKYINGKCCKMVMGIHKTGSVTREVASFLKIPNWKSFTGHCMRRTGATLLVDAGGDEVALKRFGGWSSAKVAQGYIEESKRNKNETAYKILLSNLRENETRLTNSRLETRQNTADAQEQEFLKPNSVAPVVTSSSIGLPDASSTSSSCSPVASVALPTVTVSSEVSSNFPVPVITTSAESHSVNNYSADVNSALASTGLNFHNATLTNCTFTLNFYNKNNI